jgi:hypothetical protein
MENLPSVFTALSLADNAPWYTLVLEISCQPDELMEAESSGRLAFHPVYLWAWQEAEQTKCFYVGIKGWGGVTRFQRGHPAAYTALAPANKAKEVKVFFGKFVRGDVNLNEPLTPITESEQNFLANSIEPALITFFYKEQHPLINVQGRRWQPTGIGWRGVSIAVAEPAGSWRGRSSISLANTP